MYAAFRHMGPNRPLMWIPLILIVLIIIAVYMIWKNSSNKNKPDNNRALERLNERFVNGEIDEEEYLKKKDLLNR